jgi:CBS domain-containing protein
MKVCCQWRDIAQVIVVVVLNTVLAAHLPLLHGKPQPKLMSDLFAKDLDTDRAAEWTIGSMPPVFNMFLCYAMKTSMTILALTLPLSAGVVAPVMIIGALIGRIYGMLLPEFIKDFLLSTPDSTYVITAQDRADLVARFAIVGAAAHATAVTRAFAMAITIYEVLTLPSSLLPLCSSCLAAIFVANKVSLPFFDMNLTGRGLGGISALTHTEYANKTAVGVMRDLHSDADVLHETATLMEIRALLNNTETEGVTHFAILQNVECQWVSDGVASMLRGSITRKSLEGLASRNLDPKVELHLLSPEFTVPKDSNSEPIVVLNPQTVTPDQFVKDVYILFKASEIDCVFVVEGNCLQGVITYKELLGHALDKPWFG